MKQLKDCIFKAHFSSYKKCKKKSEYHAIAPRSAPKVEKNSPIIDGAKFIKRFQPKLIYDQRGLLYQGFIIGCVGTLKGGRLYQEI